MEQLDSVQRGERLARVGRALEQQLALSTKSHRVGEAINFAALFAGGDLDAADDAVCLAGRFADAPAEIVEVAQLADLAEPQLSGDELRPLPIVLARLGMPASSMGWMISLTPDHRKLAITASDDYLSAGRASVQLWWLSGDGAPQPLAILGTERDSTVVVDVPPGVGEGRALVFAISLEPPGGSPTGQPTRPVLDRASNDVPAI